MKNLYSLLFIPALFLSTLSSSAQAILQTDSMQVPRVFHQLQPLGNGKLLVMGGQHGTTLERSCEIYDLNTGKWTMTDSLHFARSKFASVVTIGGKVLAIGGETTQQGPVLNVESYDPVTETWSVEGVLGIVSNCYAIVTPSGEILVDRYLHYYKGNADGSTWTEETPPQHVSCGERPTCITLNSGKILCVGGQPGGNDFGVEYTNFVGQPTSFMVNNNTGNLLALLPDGKVLVAGGMNCETYDPVSRSFAQADVNPGIISTPLMPMSDGRIAAMRGGKYVRPARWPTLSYS